MKVYIESARVKGFTYKINGWSGFEVGYEESYYPFLDKVRINYYLR